MTEFAVITITLICLFLFWLGTGRYKHVMVFFLLWIGIVMTLSYIGFFTNTRSLPPRMLFVLLPSVLYVIYFYRKLKPGVLKQKYLVAIHTMRIPVELMLYRLYGEGRIPKIMTFEGWNFDILMGITALLLLLHSLIFKQQLQAIFFRIWNVAGLLFLSVIVITALVSAPSPIQLLAFEQPNIAILQFPYTLLPAVIVPLVLLSHLLGLKKKE